METVESLSESRDSAVPDRVLTAAEVARLLKLNVETVYTLIRKSGLPAARVGGQWRFSGAKVLRWFESRHHAKADRADSGQ